MITCVDIITGKDAFELKKLKTFLFTNHLFWGIDFQIINW